MRSYTEYVLRQDLMYKPFLTWRRNSTDSMVVNSSTKVREGFSAIICLLSDAGYSAMLIGWVEPIYNVAARPQRIGGQQEPPKAVVVTNNKPSERSEMHAATAT